MSTHSRTLLFRICINCSSFCSNNLLLVVVNKQCVHEIIFGIAVTILYYSTCTILLQFALQFYHAHLYSSNEKYLVWRESDIRSQFAIVLPKPFNLVRKLNFEVFINSKLLTFTID